MKTTTYMLLAGCLVLAGCLSGVRAQDSAASAPAAVGPAGPGWCLTPEQRAERQKQVQDLVANLRAKRDNGTITAQEKARLDQMEQAGGWCVNGVPRGGGRRAGWGFSDATGPRAQAGTCPLINNPQATVVTPVMGRRGPGFGMGWRGGRGGGGMGLRNGTGPRSQTGTCPLLAPASGNEGGSKE